MNSSGLVHLNANSMSYGGIPYSEYFKKNEVSAFYENANELLTNHYRSTLTDLAPDTPWLASDEPRRANDPGYGTRSTDRLTILHNGTRCTDDPYAPDQFLGHIGGMTDKDPRGNALGPDMRKLAEQRYARGNLIKYYDDSDNSIQSTQVTPMQMMAKLKSMQYIVKDKLKIFSTAFGGWHNGGTKNNVDRGNPLLKKIKQDDLLLDITEIEQGNRRDLTSIKGTDELIGYKSTPDNRIAVTRYGSVRKLKARAADAWNNNRLSTYKDQKQISINGQLVNRGIARVIINLEKINEKKYQSAKGNTTYGKSRHMVNKRKREKLDEIQRIAMTKPTAPESANTQYFEGKLMKQPKGVMHHNNRKLTENIEFNHSIAKIMKQATRRARDKTTDDIRSMLDNVAFTAVHSTRQYEQKNKQKTNKVNKRLSRHAKDTHHIEEGKQTKNYAGIKPNRTNRTFNKTSKTPYGDESKYSIHRQSKLQGRAQADKTHMNEYDTNQSKFEFGVFNRADRAGMANHVQRDFNRSKITHDNTIYETNMSMF